MWTAVKIQHVTAPIRQAEPAAPDLKAVMERALSMARRFIARLDKFDVDNLQLLANKIACAQQAVSPAAVPDGVVPAEAKSFFRNSILKLADYRYLLNCFWRDLADRFKIKNADFPRLLFDFNTEELFLAGKGEAP